MQSALARSNLFCSKCSKPLEESRIMKQRYCLSCHAENMRQNRPKHSELSEPQKLKANARSYASAYVKRGTLKKNPCQKCGCKKAEKHHEDYSKPLDVIWLWQRMPFTISSKNKGI